MVTVREAFQAIQSRQERKDDQDTNDLVILAEELLGVYEQDNDELEVAGEWIRRLGRNGDPDTIVIHDDKFYCGPVGEVFAELEAAYCKRHGQVKCCACGSYEDKLQGLQDCQACHHTVDGSPQIEPETLYGERFNVLEDTGDHLLLEAKERLPTSATEQNHSYVFLKLSYHDDDSGDCGFRYCLTLSVVNVGSAGRRGMREVASQYGTRDQTELELADSLRIQTTRTGKIPQAIKAQLLLDVGIRAVAGEWTGNCRHRLFQQAIEQYQLLSVMGGAVLNSPQNAIGSTGWDLMKGDVLAGLRRHQRGESPPLFGDDKTVEEKKGRPKVTANKFIINEVHDMDGDGAFNLIDIAEQLKASLAEAMKASDAEPEDEPDIDTLLDKKLEERETKAKTKTEIDKWISEHEDFKTPEIGHQILDLIEKEKLPFNARTLQLAYDSVTKDSQTKKAADEALKKEEVKNLERENASGVGGGQPANKGKTADESPFDDLVGESINPNRVR